MPAEPPPLKTAREILTGAGRALGRIDLWGTRGLTGLSVEAIEDMALALVLLGLVAIPPDQTQPPEVLVAPRLKAF